MRTKITHVWIVTLFVMLFQFPDVIARNTTDWSSHPSYGENVNDICFSGERLWLATGGGLVSYNTVTGKFAYFNRANARLPENEVMLVCPYADGKVAYSTKKFVGIFDKTNIKVFNTTNSPIRYAWNNSKIAFLNGNLYVGTVQRLLVYDQANWKTLMYVNPMMSNPDYITDIKKGPNDSIFVLKWRGVYQVCGDTLKDYNTDIRGIREIQFTSDTLWMAATTGLYYGRDTLIQKLDTTNSILPDNDILRIKKDVRSRLWLLTRKGLSMLNPSNLEITNFTNDSIPFRNGLFMETDSLGNVWLASKKPGGLWKFDGITWTRIGYRNGLHSNRIKNFVIGKNHHIWIDSEDSTICDYDGNESNVYDSTALSKIRDRRNLYKHNKRFVFFIDSDVIVDYSDSIRSIIRTGYVNKMQKAAYDTINGIFWGTTRFGLERIQNGVSDTIALKPIASSNHIVGLYLEKSSSVLISTFVTPTSSAFVTSSAYGGQLLRYDGSSMQLIFTCPNPYQYISALVTDSAGNLWIGVIDNRYRGRSYGGGMMKIHGDSCTTYTSSNSQIPGNSVTDLSIDANGHLWIADMEGGLIEFDRESSWTIYNSENSVLPSDNVELVTVDEVNNVWVYAVDGGITFIPGTMKIPTYIPSNTLIEPETLEVYPMPCSGEVNLKFGASFTSALVNIYNLAGQKVLESAHNIPENGIMTLSVGNLSKGIYMMKVSSNGSTVCKKLMVK